MDHKLLPWMTKIMYDFYMPSVVSVLILSVFLRITN